MPCTAYKRFIVVLKIVRYIFDRSDPLSINFVFHSIFLRDNCLVLAN
jgi:hypothetical protein